MSNSPKNPQISPRRQIRILCVHQGAELYGSDRSFLQAVEALRDGWPDAEINVVLAADGPLKALMSKVANHVKVRNLCVLRLADPVSTGLKSTVALGYYVARAIIDVVQADLVYINTTVIADYMLASRFVPGRAVIHVREIPKKRAMPLIQWLCKASRARLIFNSNATRDAFNMDAATVTTVIYNGVDPAKMMDKPKVPEQFSNARPLKLAMLGRISAWKGQDCLIEAVSLLVQESRQRINVRIVGSTFRDLQDPILQLQRLIDQHSLGDCITIEPFNAEPSEVYSWADICVVPSRLPEPFGRVAIEAMALSRPVIASAHGGLTEIVQDGSGWLVSPNDPTALSRQIQQIINEPQLVLDASQKAYLRFNIMFSTATMRVALVNIISDWIPRLQPKRLN